MVRLAAVLALSTFASLAATQACSSFGSDEPRATADAGGADAVLADAGPDAATFRCNGTPFLADGFDRDTPAGNGWTTVGQLSLDRDAGLPAPSLALEEKASSSVERSLVWNDTAFSKGPTVCVELDVRIEANASDFGEKAFAEVLAIELPQEAIFAEMSDVGLSLADFGGSRAIGGFRPGAWQHLVVRLPFGADVATASLDDGIPSRSTNPLRAAPASLTVRVGLRTGTNGGVVGPIAVHIDNVRATAQ